MADDPRDIRREIEGLGPRPEPSARKQTRPKAPRHQREHRPGPKRPTANPMPSEVAQRWYDLGNQHGWEFPYDVNYLALAISDRIEKDDFLVRVREKQGEDQVKRILIKMVEVWWRPSNPEVAGYINGEVNRRNAKEYFLDEDWDDVRYYAWSSLRAAYLKVHGKRKPLKALAEEGDFGRDMRERLKNLRLNQQIEDMLKEPPVDRTPLDESARERLRSFPQRHGGKK